jgi:hypothetical protein
LVFDDLEQENFEKLFTFITIFFFFDILTNFNTAYIDLCGELELSRNKIIKNYLSTWFFIDFISNFPLDWVLLAISIFYKLKTLNTKNHQDSILEF